MPKLSGSYLFFRSKDEGTLRFCVGHRKLNAVTSRDLYPLSRMDEAHKLPGRYSSFPALAANSGYCQIKVNPSDSEKATISSHNELYHFTCMPFGLKNAPVTFQLVVDIRVSSVNWQFALAYLDKLVIFSQTPRKHVNHTRLVLRLLMKAGLTWKLKKCA